MSNTPHVRIVDATFEEPAPPPAAPSTPPPLSTPPDLRGAQAMVATEIAIAIAPVAGVVAAGFVLYAEIEALWKHAKRNARRRAEGGR